MKAAKFITFCLALLILSSCGTEDKKRQIPTSKENLSAEAGMLPIDKGFTRYIAGYTSGIVSANSVIEIRFTPEFAARADGKTPPSLFTFDPAIKGKTEWTDETTLVFRPAKLLEPGKTFSGSLNLGKLAEVEGRLKDFPFAFRTLKKNFLISAGALGCTPSDPDKYVLYGEMTASDYIPSPEAESFLKARAGRKQLPVIWDHTDALVHKFTVTGIERTDKEQKVELEWDGSPGDVRQKGSLSVRIPPSGEFSILDFLVIPGEGPRIDVVFSDPLDAAQELDGLIWFNPENEVNISISSNIISIFPVSQLLGDAELNIESSVRNTTGGTLSSSSVKKFDFTPVPPSLALTGQGVIMPSSQNLIFPFKAANLRAVDLKIIRIFENNLPYFLQENDITAGYSIKRFGKPVYSGRIDLVKTPESANSTWNLYTIDLDDYIDVEPGILYKVELGMRKSYSLLPCSGDGGDNKYEKLLQESEEKSRELWDDPDNYYEDIDEYLYYSLGFDWNDRNDPCKDAYYSPDKKVSRNILASNFGMMAKKGADNNLHVIINDLLTALPLNEVTVDVYDYQNQLIKSGITGQEGAVTIYCERNPFLIIARKDQDRNYLKINDGSALSLSSFDVSGTKPEKGIKTFIYGERDVWRPGDSIFLSLFIKDLTNNLPADHPVQFELINPLEQKVDNQILRPGGNNLIVVRTKTDQDALTGNYTARFRIGGATFDKRIRVETIKPNRLKIDLQFNREILGGSKGASPGTLNVRWLSGAVAGNLGTTVEYLLKHTGTEFEKFSQYTFDDPSFEFYSESVRILDTRLDEKGNASFSFDPGKEINAPGMLNAVFTAKVSEKGGDESITQSSYRYAPYPVFAGINLPALKGKDRMLYTDESNEIKLVTVDEKGNPVSSEVELTIYKINYRWWWESDRENLAYYISNNIYKPVISQTVKTDGGQGTTAFRINKNEWGRYLIRATVPGGHSTGKIILVEWPWEYGIKGNAEGATLLSVSTDKEKYYPGDEIRISFPAPENARAIITLENSTGVLEEIRAVTTGINSEVKFRARPEMAPNVYAYVTIIQPHAQTVNDMPVRLYGLVPVLVEDRDSRLSPQISMPDELRSQKEFEIRISEAAKRPMNYTLAIVDEGLLDITGFKTPDPWNYFYSREALGVQTWDIYDLVIGAFGGTLERIFAIGGDETVIDRAANKAQRFTPVVKFLGPFTLAQGKSAIHRVTLPNYTGSVRAMVIAGSDKAFGAFSKSVPVKDPLMILATAPRVISPGENVILPVTLFVQQQNITSVTLSAEGNDLVSFDKDIINVPISEQGETDTGFSFTAGEKTGVAKIKITASGGGEKASYDMEIDVRSPNPAESRSGLKILNPRERWETSFNTFGMPGSNSATLEASSLPAVNLESRTEYLLYYPHGCSEQIISAAFPRIWLKDLAPDNSAVAQNAPVNIKEAINKLMQRQMNDGGIALWPGANQPDNWVTSYAGHFLYEAERAGYIVPSGLKQNWISYQKRKAQDWKYDIKFKQTANDQAYRLFTLALAGQPERGAMNRLRESDALPQLSKWLLAAAYATSGRTEVAGELLDMRNVGTEPEYQDYYYGSQLRDKAVILYTLTILGEEAQALPLLRSVSESLNSDSWFSTQSLAWALFAYMKYAALLPGDRNGPYSFELTLNGEGSEINANSNQIWSKNLKINEGKNSLIVENRSDKPVYLNLVNKGIPLMSDVLKEEKGITMKIEYINMQLEAIDQKTLEQGTDFMMAVKVTNNTFSGVENIALTQMVPSGWEIQNTRLYEANYGIKENSYDYRDIRDDRVNTYFSLGRGESKTFVLVLNAAYKGEFYHPSVWCEAMYQENCYSRHPGYKVRVTDQKVE